MLPCRAQLAFVLIVVLLGTASMLQSCGQTGDLYLPPPEPASQPASEPAPANGGANNESNGDA